MDKNRIPKEINIAWLIFLGLYKLTNGNHSVLKNFIFVSTSNMALNRSKLSLNWQNPKSVIFILGFWSQFVTPKHETL